MERYERIIVDGKTMLFSIRQECKMNFDDGLVDVIIGSKIDKFGQQTGVKYMDGVPIDKVRIIQVECITKRTPMVMDWTYGDIVELGKETNHKYMKQGERRC